MKKVAVASAVLAAITASSAFADMSVEVYSDRTTADGNFFESARAATQGVVFGYSPMDNLGLEAEITTNKDIELSGGYKFDLTENFYLKPQLGYVAKFKDGFATSAQFEEPESLYNTYNELTLKLPNSNVAKLGLEAGTAFGDFFASARYRVELATEAQKLTANSVVLGGATLSTNLEKEKSRLGRTDLMVGYNLDAVTVTAKAIHRSQLNKDLREVNGVFGYDNSFWSSEVKATLTNFDAVTPYVQFARNHENKDNQIKLGAKFAF